MMKEFDYDDLIFEMAHRDCEWCIECTSQAFVAFKISVAEYASTGIEDHYGTVGVSSERR
jgi:hypothetical protein